MANMEHYRIIKAGVESWNRWRQANPDMRPDLSGANLAGIDLASVDLSEANLYRANLQHASLLWADFTWANFTQTDLSGADLEWANLRGASFLAAILREANFTHAPMGYTTFGNVDLSTAIGLHKVQHHFPSTIGIDTLYRSQGKIPPEFLDGCEVPAELLKRIFAADK